MKKFIKNALAILTMMCIVFTVSYLTVAFSELNMNILEFSKGERIGILGVTIFLGLICIVIINGDLG